MVRFDGPQHPGILLQQRGVIIQQVLDGELRDGVISETFHGLGDMVLILLGDCQTDVDVREVCSRLLPKGDDLLHPFDRQTEGSFAPTDLVVKFGRAIDREVDCIHRPVHQSFSPIIQRRPVGLQRGLEGESFDGIENLTKLGMQGWFTAQNLDVGAMGGNLSKDALDGGQVQSQLVERDAVVSPCLTPLITHPAGTVAGSGDLEDHHLGEGSGSKVAMTEKLNLSGSLGLDHVTSISPIGDKPPQLCHSDFHSHSPSGKRFILLDELLSRLLLACELESTHISAGIKPSGQGCFSRVFFNPPLDDKVIFRSTIYPQSERSLVKNPRLSGSTISMMVLMVGIAALLFSGGCSKTGQPSGPSDDKTGEQAKGGGTECPPGVVATIDGRPITRDEADRRAGINVRLSGTKETDPDYEKKVQLAHKGAVDFLIQAYVLQAAATETIEVSTREIETELLSWKFRAPDQKAWDEFLKSNNLTEAQFKEVLVKDLRIRKQMEKAAQREVPTPSPEEAQQFYDVNTQAFSWPYRVQYDEITWVARPNISPASREQAKKGMESLAGDLLRNPALFDEMLAREKPKNTLIFWGPLGTRNDFVSVEKLPKPIVEALQSLVQGEISPVIETPLGFSIIRIASLSQTYDSAYKEIVESIYTEKCRLNLNDWINRQRQKHKIRICDTEYYRGGISESTGEVASPPSR